MHINGRLDLYEIWYIDWDQLYGEYFRKKEHFYRLQFFLYCYHFSGRITQGSKIPKLCPELLL